MSDKGGKMYKLDQNKTPLFTTLKDVYVKRDITPFHVPGHKRGNGADPEFLEFVGKGIHDMDVTIFKMVDGLHNPKSCILEAQQLAADAYGVDHTFFAVNGTSGAIQAMVMSVVKAGEKILVPRNVHKSVQAGIILSGAEPVYMEPEIDHELEIAHGVSYKTVEDNLKEHPEVKAVLLINPTYYGVTADIKSIVNLVHSYDIPLIVDEAHGPHLHFNENLPLSAVDAGADIIAQSTHKILGALTQMSLLHVQGDLVDVKRVKAILSMLHTTSPSYPLMASLDSARRHIAVNGKELLENTIKVANYLRQEVNMIEGFYSFGNEVCGRDGIYDFDPTKVTITSKKLGLRGQELERILTEEYNIQVELSDFYNVLAIITIGDTFESVDKLIAALKDISVKYTGRNEALNNLKPALPIKVEQVLIPREAFYSDKIVEKFEDSVGRISGEYIMAYPPGIPIIYPGERITKEIIDYIKALMLDGLDVQGMDDPTLNEIKIIDEEDAMYIYVEKMKNRLLGTPLNLGADVSGIDFGLETLLHDYPDTFAELDIVPIQKEIEDFTNKSMKYKNSILKTCEKLAEKVHETILEGYRPITIGGDHSLALGTISGVSKAKGNNIGVIWVDAHGDMNTKDTTITGNVHGMPLALLQGYGDKDLVNCYFDGPKIKSENVVLFGVRDLDPLEAQFIKDKKIKVLSYNYIEEIGLQAALEEVKDYLKVDELHISFDLDVISPDVAPGVSVPVEQGFNMEDTTRIFSFLLKEFFISSVDIVEFNPIYDKGGVTAEHVVEIVEFIKNPD